MYLSYPIALAGYVKESRLSHTASIRMTPTHGAPEKTLEVSFTHRKQQLTGPKWANCTSTLRTIGFVQCSRCRGKQSTQTTFVPCLDDCSSSFKFGIHCQLCDFIACFLCEFLATTTKATTMKKANLDVKQQAKETKRLSLDFGMPGIRNGITTSDSQQQQHQQQQWGGGNRKIRGNKKPKGRLAPSQHNRIATRCTASSQSQSVRHYLKFMSGIPNPPPTP